MTESEIIELLRELLSGRKHGEFSFEFLVEQGFDTYRPDLIIKAGKRNIAAIEVKSNNLSKSVMTFSTDFYFLFKVRYFIYTDGFTFVVFDRFNNPKESIKTDIRGFITRMTRLISQQSLRKLKQAVSVIIQDQISQASNTFPKLSNLFDYYNNKITRELKLSFDYSLFFEGGKTDIDSFEHQFFVNLLDNVVPDTIYRYSTFGRVFQILDENRIAMLGLPGMNDTTEPNYVDNYLNDTNDNFWELPPQSIAAINRRFIMSCTIHKDDLMQWRLYGENAKGACIKFETKASLETNQRFYLGRVKYANKENEHPELIFLKNIIIQVREKLFFDIRFILLYVWRHFFKPKEYDYEGEVRLLYIHRKVEREKKWIIAEPYSIVNPMVIFDLSKNEFPLKITEVMLGPKRPESQLNKTQLKEMLNEKGQNIEVTESERNVYR